MDSIEFYFYVTNRSVALRRRKTRTEMDPASEIEGIRQRRGEGSLSLMEGC